MSRHEVCKAVPMSRPAGGTYLRSKFKKELPMKGIQGLILAIGLGFVGAVFNWAYLVNRMSEKENVYFMGIKPNVTLNPGDAIKADHIVPVGLPKDMVGNLRKFAVLYDRNISPDLQSVVGQKVWRVIQGSRLLMEDDLKTPPPELRLEPDEEAMFVPIDTRSIIPSLIVPGDRVKFLVSRGMPGRPTPAAPLVPPAVGEPIPDPANATENPIVAAPPGPIQEIGPFKVLSIGNRLGSVEVMKSARIPQLQENVLMISIKSNDRQKALELQSRLDATNYKQVGVRLVPRQ
jgi:hypothetical protein